MDTLLSRVGVGCGPRFQNNLPDHEVMQLPQRREGIICALGAIESVRYSISVSGLRRGDQEYLTGSPEDAGLALEPVNGGSSWEDGKLRKGACGRVALYWPQSARLRLVLPATARAPKPCRRPCPPPTSSTRARCGQGHVACDR